MAVIAEANIPSGLAPAPASVPDTVSGASSIPAPALAPPTFYMVPTPEDGPIVPVKVAGPGGPWAADDDGVDVCQVPADPAAAASGPSKSLVTPSAPTGSAPDAPVLCPAKAAAVSPALTSNPLVTLDTSDSDSES